MALYELGKAHFAINSDGTFRYLGRLIKKDWYNIGTKKLTCKHQFSKKDGIITDTVVVNYIAGTFKELEPKIIYTAEEKVAYEKEKKLVEPKEDNPFKLNPHEFDETNIVRNQDMSSKVTKWNGANAFDVFKFNEIPVMKGTLELVEEIMNYGKPKNRIPDRVVFNQDKGKVTVLMSKHLDGVAPYWAYTSKVHGDDEYDAEFGFLLSYYKYLIRRFDLKVQKEMIERIFKILKERRYVYLLGVVENEVLKINGVESYKDWEDIYLAITDPSNAKNVYDYTWDHLEWKEMLRVHELEIKREEQKAIRKEIKKHEQEIEKLKKKGV